MLEKKGLRPAAEILENYVIDCETDLSVIDQDDFNKFRLEIEVMKNEVMK